MRITRRDCIYIKDTKAKYRHLARRAQNDNLPWCIHDNITGMDVVFELDTSKEKEASSKAEADDWLEEFDKAADLVMQDLGVMPKDQEAYSSWRKEMDLYDQAVEKSVETAIETEQEKLRTGQFTTDDAHKDIPVEEEHRRLCNCEKCMKVRGWRVSASDRETLQKRAKEVLSDSVTEEQFEDICYYIDEEIELYLPSKPIDTDAVRTTVHCILEALGLEYKG